MHFEIGTMIFQLIATFLPLILIILIVIFVVRLVRRIERRSEERLKLDKENTRFQQQQNESIQELNQRLTKIEDMLKEVE